MKVVLLGPGLMGAQIACEYAIGGHEVTVLASTARNALEYVTNRHDKANPPCAYSDSGIKVIKPSNRAMAKAPARM